MFNNPIGLAAAMRVFTGGHRAVVNYGDAIWDDMCFRYESFTTAQLAESLVADFKLTPITARQYVKAFMKYCRAVPGDFKGPNAKLEKVAPGKWGLVDAGPID